MLRQLPTLPFVGRQTERSAVSEAVSRAVAGHGCVVTFRGDAGIGKSRLLEACAAAVPAPTATAVVSLALDEGLDGSALVRRSATRPLAVFVDDAHLASAAQESELARLAAATRSHRLVLVVAACGERPIRGVAPSEPSGAFRLMGLDDDAIALIARAASAPHGIAGETIRNIVHAAGGNPRYALELAFPESSGLAPSACASIAAARDVLDAKAFDVLSVCSALGDAFDPDWIAGIAGTSRMRVAEALQRAQDIGILEDDPNLTGWMRFRYPAVRDAWYAALASFRRRLLHERAARRLSRPENASTGAYQGSRDFLTVLGAQYAAIGQRAAAARALTAAGEAAMNEGAYVAAGDAFRRAAGQSCAGSESWLDVQRKAIRAHLNSGDWGGMIPLLTTALSQIERSRTPKLADEFLRNLFFAHLNDGDRDAAERVAAEIAALPTPEAALHAQISTLILAYARCYQGRVDDAARLVASIDLAALSDQEARLRFFLTSAEVASVRGSLEEALEHVDRASAIARVLSVRGQAVCATVGTEIATRWSDFAAAERFLNEQTALSKRRVAPNDIRSSANNDRMRIALLRGELHEARSLFQHGLPMRSSGQHNVAFENGMAVSIGMHIGDASLVDTFFDPDLLLASARKRDAESCGNIIGPFSLVLMRRGMDRLLRAVLDRCIGDDSIDPYLGIQLCAIRFAADATAARAMEQVGRFVASSESPALQALRKLCEAHFALRRRLRGGAEYALDAAHRFEAIGWRLYSAEALECAGETRGATVIYTACGASADVLRLQQSNTRKHRRAPFGAALTPRETQVAKLLSQGRSNRQIASALGVSVRTTDHHVEAVFSKLGIRARWQLTPALMR
jgi:DNA-binding CsgD family transcriptional regulator/tetratricopeptide (TPR) repeat protein